MWQIQRGAAGTGLMLRILKNTKVSELEFRAFLRHSSADLELGLAGILVGD